MKVYFFMFFVEKKINFNYFFIYIKIYYYFQKYNKRIHNMGFSMHMYINVKVPIFMLIMLIVEGDRDAVPSPPIS